MFDKLSQETVKKFWMKLIRSVFTSHTRSFFRYQLFSHIAKNKTCYIYSKLVCGDFIIHTCLLLICSSVVGKLWQCIYQWQLWWDYTKKPNTLEQVVQIAEYTFPCLFQLHHKGRRPYDTAEWVQWISQMLLSLEQIGLTLLYRDVCCVVWLR